MPSSSCFLNISTPVTTVLRVSRKPTISTSSPTFTLPRSIRPVTTVPRPEIEKMSSIGIRNGLSSSRAGCGTLLSTASISASICFSHFSSPFKRSERGQANHRRVVSREADSFSATRALRARPDPAVRDHPPHRTCSAPPRCTAHRPDGPSSTCSRVCGIGPSVAATTRIAPSICAAPVIMFLM